jgi:hypothetical protein
MYSYRVNCSYFIVDIFCQFTAVALMSIKLSCTFHHDHEMDVATSPSSRHFLNYPLNENKF